MHKNVGLQDGKKSGALSGWNPTNGESAAGGGKMPGCAGTSGCRMSYLKGAITLQNGHFSTCFQRFSR